MLTNTRTNAKGVREEGPNGITLWNTIFPKKIANEESAITLCNSLMAMKLESLDTIDKIIGRWKFWMHENGNNPKEAVLDFEREMEEVKERFAGEGGAAKKQEPRRARSKNEIASKSAKQPTRKRSDGNSGASKKEGVPNSKSLNRKASLPGSFALNSISEEDLENVSTFGEDKFPARNEIYKANAENKARKSGK